MAHSVHAPDCKNNQDAANLYFSTRYPGYRLASLETGAVTRFILEPIAKTVPCPRCGTMVSRFHEYRQRIVKDCDPLSNEPVEVVLPVRRVRCHCCSNTGRECLPSWVLPGRHITKRLGARVQRMLRHRMTVKDISLLTGVNETLVKELDMAFLDNFLAKVSLKNAKRIAIDEISIHKGHKYATVIMDLDRRVILDVLEGKRKDDVKSFFNRLVTEGCDTQIVSASVDMNAAYPDLVDTYLPNCLLAYDRFHVVRQWSRDVLVPARKLCMNAVRDKYKERIGRGIDEKVAKAFMNDELLMLRGMDRLFVSQKLSQRQQDRLDTIINTNPFCAKLYAATRLIGLVWEAKSIRNATKKLQNLVKLCQKILSVYGFAPVRKFAGMLERRKEGIVNACVVKFGTNILEGANNTAKVIKRIAYGYRDFKYFSLKIKDAFNDNLDRFKRSLGSILVWGGVVHHL